MKKSIFGILLVIATALAIAMPVAAQGPGSTWNGGTPPTSCYSPTLGIDNANGRQYVCGNGTGWKADSMMLGTFQGTTATAITDGNFNVLTGPAIKVPKGMANVVGKHIIVRGSGVYTTAAASLLNVNINLCQVSGCASGTTVAPAGCVVTSTNQANVLANGQFAFECEMIVATTGTGGTLMAKSTAKFNLGATTAAALSQFADTATAVSAATDLTVDEFVHPQFKFTTLNAGNAATLQSLTVVLSN